MNFKNKKNFFIILFAALLATACSEQFNRQEPAEISAAEIKVISGTYSETTVQASQSEEIVETEEIFDKECAALIERFAISDKNSYMISPIEYEIDDENNSIYVNITFDNYADIYTLSDCILDVSVENGDFSFGSSSIGLNGGIDLRDRVFQDKKRNFIY